MRASLCEGLMKSKEPVPFRAKMNVVRHSYPDSMRRTP